MKPRKEKERSRNEKLTEKKRGGKYEGRCKAKKNNE